MNQIYNIKQRQNNKNEIQLSVKKIRTENSRENYVKLKGSSLGISISLLKF